MAVQKVVNLFSNIKGFEKAEALALAFKPPRVRYKKTTYTKTYKNDVVKQESYTKEILNETIVDDIALWGEMKKVYINIANYFIAEIPFGSTKTVFDFGEIVLWKQEYTNKSYMYYGVRYKEVPDLFYEAEIKGSENLPIDERLKLHTKLLELLKQNVRMSLAVRVAKYYVKKSERRKLNEFI